MLDGKEEKPFDRFNFLFREFFVSFFLSSKIRELIKRRVIIPDYENKFRALSNHVPNGKKKQQTNKNNNNKKRKQFFFSFSFPLSDNINRKSSIIIDETWQALTFLFLYY